MSNTNTPATNSLRSNDMSVAFPVTAPGLKPYQIVDTATGEVKSKYKYLPGHPRQYRF